MEDGDLIKKSNMGKRGEYKIKKEHIINLERFYNEFIKLEKEKEKSVEDKKEDKK